MLAGKTWAINWLGEHGAPVYLYACHDGCSVTRLTHFTALWAFSDTTLSLHVFIHHAH